MSAGLQAAALLDQVPGWAGLPRSIETLGGGITNRNYRVVVDGGAYVVRMPAEQGALLGIDREVEHQASRLAAAAGMGDRFFDLANFAVNHQLPDDEERYFLQAYLGQAGPSQEARLRLMRVMSDFREAMWGVVQQGISDLDFDFRAYADKHFQRLLAAAGQPSYRQWLRLVA